MKKIYALLQPAIESVKILMEEQKMLVSCRAKDFVLFVIIACVGNSALAQSSDYYPILARALSSPVSLTVDEARKAHSDEAVMFRMESARNELLGIQPHTPELNAIRHSVLPALEHGHSSLGELSRLSGHAFDFEGLLERAPAAAPGAYKVFKRLDDKRPPEALSTDESKGLAEFAGKLAAEAFSSVRTRIAISNERDNYREQFAAARSAAVQKLIDAANRRYASIPAVNANIVQINADGSWNNTFNSDWLCLRNDAGKDLTDCSIFVRLNGENLQNHAKEQDRHFHYIEQWPAGKWLYIKYPSRCAIGFATNQSVDTLQDLDVFVLSHECTTHVLYTYEGKEFDDDVARYYSTDLKPRFFGKWYSDNLISDNGFELRYEGDLTQFPPCTVKLTIQQGNYVKSKRWRVGVGDWSSGENWYMSDQSFNGYNPDKVAITIEFPHSGFTRTAEWDRSR